MSVSAVVALNKANGVSPASFRASTQVARLNAPDNRPAAAGLRPASPDRIERLPNARIEPLAPQAPQGVFQRLFHMFSKPVAVGGVIVGAMGSLVAGCATSSAAAATSFPVATVSEMVAVDADHEYVRHIYGIRQQLSAAKLPTTASDVTVWVVDDSARSMDTIRAVRDPQVGLAARAQVRPLDDVAYYADWHRDLEVRVSKDLGALRRGDGVATNALIIDMARGPALRNAAHLRAITKLASQDHTEIATLSQTASARSVATQIVDAMARAPAGSKTNLALAKLGADRPAQIDAMTKTVRSTLKEPRGKRLAAAAASFFETEVGKARSARVLVFAAVGDTRTADEGKSGWSTPVTDATDGVIRVGSSDLAPMSGGAVTSTTARGWIDLAAPGDSFPLGGSATTSSTRYSSAYAASAAALMLAENPSLTPDQIEELMIDTARDVEGTVLDGSGVIDPVALVRRARDAKFGKVTFAPTRAHFLAKKAMHVHTAAAADDPYVAHLAHVKTQLSARGLPTRADGVHVIVAEPSWGSHAGAVLRTIGDAEVGLAPGADLQLVYPSGHYSTHAAKVSASATAARRATRGGQDPFMTNYVADVAETVHFGRAQDLRVIRTSHTSGETTLVNMSYGLTAEVIAQRIVDDIREAPVGSAAQAYLQKLPKDKDARINVVAGRVHGLLTGDKATNQLKSARKALQKELDLARDANLLVFVSAGNSFDEGKPGPGASRHVDDGFDNLIVVGATKLNNPKTTNDDTMATFSSEGAVTIVAPGHQLPVGLWGKINGTSFAAPYSVSTAALLLAQNPDLTPAQIESILTTAPVASDVPGHRDGSGVIDPVKAVEAAASCPAG